MKQLIYAVEDDPAIQELYSYTLENEFECRCFSDGRSFFEAFAQNKPCLVILDIMLPDDDGFSILSKIKEHNVPVIMVSAKDNELSKVKGLNTGADDYITKPFSVLELVARIKANLRKNTKPASTVAYGDISIDLSKHQITANGNPLQAPLKEFALLKLLCANAENVVERENIFSQVWGDNFIGETRTLDIHIKELRRKLANAGSSVEIKTVRGVGYMLT
jgi:two-component system alkaline phosphatase synthesis response regulator PhoP